MKAREGPYTGTRTWNPEPGLSVGQVNAAITKLRDVQDWKPLDVVQPGRPNRDFPPKRPRT